MKNNYLIKLFCLSIIVQIFLISFIYLQNKWVLYQQTLVAGQISQLDNIKKKELIGYIVNMSESENRIKGNSYFLNTELLANFYFYNDKTLLIKLCKKNNFLSHCRKLN